MSLKQHYIDLYNQFGVHPSAIQWSSKETQFKRFEILCDQIKPNDNILDLGCGFGDMVYYLQDNTTFKGNYLGLDFVPEFINSATTRFENDSNINFQLFDIKNDFLPNDFDVIVLSGVFNNLVDDNWKFITETIEKMFIATNRAVSFNALSTYVDYQDKELYYSNPTKLFDYCKTMITAKVTLRHDYLIKENSIPFEFTMHLKK